MKTIHCTRRDFLKATGLTASGLMLGFHIGHAAPSAATTFSPNAFIVISEENGVLLCIPIPEIGQNIRTTFAMVLSDELGADLESVTLEQAAPTHDMGHQNAGGSGSVRKQYTPLREAAAAAREMLISGAAKEWSVSPTDCLTRNNTVIGPEEQTMPFTKAAKLAQGLPVPSTPQLKPNKAFDYIGKPTRGLDATGITQGATQFGIDATPEGVAFAVMLRSPVYQGKLKRFDATAAKAMPAVKTIFEVDGKIAIIATNTWAAINASHAVDVEWDDGKYASVETDALDQQRQEAIVSATKVVHQKKNFEDTFKNSAIKTESEFYIPTIAHATLEPPNCTVWFHDGGVEIWGSCQVLNQLYKQLPTLTNLPHEKITYHQLRIGGGFGRKLAIDYVKEGIAIAKQVDYPVKMTFTREDDIHNDLYRLPDQYKIRVGLASNGYPNAVEETTVRSGRPRPSELGKLFTAAKKKFKAVDPALPRGWLRAPGHNVTCFAEQSIIDIMAEKAGIDPIDYHLALHGDTEAVKKLRWKKSPSNVPELCRLLKVVKQRSAWKSDPDYGYGVATFIGYGSFSALVALVPKNPSTRTVERVYAAVNCGQVINPLGAHAQVEGGIIDALGATLYQSITLKKGRVMQSNYHDFKLLRMSEHPECDIHFEESDATPQGLGEVSYPPMMPATANALKAASGRRLTRLPLHG